MAIGNVAQNANVVQKTAEVAVAEALRKPHDATTSTIQSPAHGAPDKNHASGLTNDQVRAAAGTIGEALGIINRGLRVEVDESTNRVITQIIDRDTNEVIRQIPAQELVDLAHRLRELVGVLFDTEI